MNLSRCMFVSGLVLLLANCEKRDSVPAPAPKVAGGTALSQPNRDASPPPASAQAERDAFVVAADQQLGELREKIAQLRIDASTAGADVRESLWDKVHALEIELKSAEQKLAQLRLASLESWSVLRQGTTTAIAHLRESVRRFGK